MKKKNWVMDDEKPWTKYDPNLHTSLYRYESDSDGRLVLYKYCALRETPHGYWIGEIISTYHEKEPCDYIVPLNKWVSKNRTKKWAHTTEEDAKIAFYERKRSQIAHLMVKLRRAEKEYINVCGALQINTQEKDEICREKQREWDSAYQRESGWDEILY